MSSMSNISLHASLRACAYYLKANRQCTRCPVLLNRTDYKEDNKKMFFNLKAGRTFKEVNPQINLTLSLSDIPHLGENLEASFTY